MKKKVGDLEGQSSGRLVSCICLFQLLCYDLMHTLYDPVKDPTQSTKLCWKLEL